MRINFKGFTLIELLVVIAIIGIIASIGVANLITAQKQARDSSRKQIISNIQTTFEQYYAENTMYPNEDDNNINSAFDNGEPPSDPKDSGDYVISFSNTGRNGYCVCAMLEGAIGNSDAPTAGATTCNWNSEGDYYCAQNKQ